MLVDEKKGTKAVTGVVSFHKVLMSIFKVGLGDMDKNITTIVFPYLAKLIFITLPLMRKDMLFKCLRA